MKIVIFAGGVGTRLWPLSRKKSPKQFEKIVNEKSTLQLAVERLYPTFQNKDIYISTGEKYVDLVAKQLPQIPKKNIIGEPEMRDVGPAVGFVSAILSSIAPNDPLLILWSDHLVKKQELFRKVIKAAEELIKKDQNRIIFIGQKPRFASTNLGWLEFGDKITSSQNINCFQFISCHYRPEEKDAQKFYQDRHHAWNLGYFMTTPGFLLSLYKEFVPEMYKKLTIIKDALNTKQYPKVLSEIYPQLEKISFDNAILEKLDPQKGLVINEDLNWSDIGAWEALKEALQKTPSENIISGKVINTDCKDSLIYNFGSQVVAAIDLDGLLVVNTKDAILVCKKESVAKIKKMVEKLSGTQYEYLT